MSIFSICAAMETNLRVCQLDQLQSLLEGPITSISMGETAEDLLLNLPWRWNPVRALSMLFTLCMENPPYLTWSSWPCFGNVMSTDSQRKLKQAVPINGDNIPPLWSVPTPSRNTQQIVLFLSHCGSYTGENHSRKICLRRISAWLCPLECHGMEGIEAAFDTKSLGNVKKVFAKSCGNPIFGQFLATRGPKMRARTRKSIGVQRLTP